MWVVWKFSYCCCLSFSLLLAVLWFCGPFLLPLFCKQKLHSWFSWFLSKGTESGRATPPLPPTPPKDMTLNYCLVDEITRCPTHCSEPQSIRGESGTVHCCQGERLILRRRDIVQTDHILLWNQPQNMMVNGNWRSSTRDAMVTN